MGDEEWAFVAPYLTLTAEEAPARDHSFREVLNALRWMVGAWVPWRLMPGDLPSWNAVYQHTQRWLAAGVFEAMVHDLGAVLWVDEGREPEPTAAIFDARTMSSSPESGGRVGYDGYKGYQ